MGAFRSKPIVDKFSKDEENDKLRCASSTMQGWRVTQEDAYNFILDYDKDTAFFSVYDGHGGHEVAEYLQRNLPQFLKDMDSYKEGDIEKTLIDGFLKMDASLITEEVMAILKDIAMEGADLEENIDTLYEEASMPVEKVIEKYRDGEAQSEKKSNESSSKSCDISGGAGSSKERSRPERSRRKDDSSSTSQTRSEESQEKSTEQSAVITDSDEKSIAEEKTKDEAEEKLEKSTSDGLKDPEQSEKNEDKTNVVHNGEVASEKKELEKCDSDSPQNQKGELCKGKGKAVMKKIVPITLNKKTTEPPQSDEEIYKIFLKKYIESEEESDDAEDLEEESSEEDDSGEVEENESENGVDENEAEEETNENDEEQSEEEEDDDDDEEILDRNYETEKPGIKSGSTGVVALLRGNELYVGNVGDSRCVVCREGKAVKMSYDHKPKNPGEKERIIKAGGTVDEVDDRVNDGLNMSRAFGDFFYKKNQGLSQTEQMVIPLPDVKTLTIDPNKDEFMVLASDGIWNVKDCQEVIDFLRPRIAKCEGRLSSVIEELFDECLSRYSFAEGTDNMTLILVQFKSNIAKRSSSPLPEAPAKKLKEDKSQESDVKC